MVKTPKYKNAPKAPEVRQAIAADAFANSQVSFLFSNFDLDGPWGLSAIREVDWKTIFIKVEGYQQMLWKEFYGPSKDNHEVSVSDLSKIAQQRISEISTVLGIIGDTLLSLHVTGKRRLYGVRDRRNCHLLWFDPWHDVEDKAVYPSLKKHT